MFDEILKYAQEQGFDKEAFAKHDEDAERELIRRVQQLNDPFAMQDLIVKYRGTINEAINSSRLANTVGKGTAEQMAIEEFQKIIKNKFDLKQKGNKPNTYITSVLPKTLKNLENTNRSGAAKMPQALERFKKVYGISVGHLKREGIENPTVDQIFNHAKAGRLSRGKDFDKSVIQRIHDRNYIEQSGGATFGSDASGDAEKITVGEQFGHSKYTPAEVRQQKYEYDTIEKEIRSFSQKMNEQRFLRAVFGIGEYKNKAENINKASINNGITNYQGRLMIRKFKKDLKKRGVL